MIERIIVGDHRTIERIRTPNDPWIAVSDDIIEHTDENQLVLDFLDVTKQSLTATGFSRFKNRLFNSQDARTIIDFASRFHGNSCRFFISCDKGYSRSAAIANGLIYLFQIHQRWFSFPEYNPNKTVFTLLCQNINITKKAQTWISSHLP